MNASCSAVSTIRCSPRLHARGLSISTWQAGTDPKQHQERREALCHFANLSAPQAAESSEDTRITP